MPHHPMMTSEQAQALDALIRLMPDGSQTNTPGVADPSRPDLLKTWLGISREEAANLIGGLLGQKTEIEKRLLDFVEGHPLDSAFEFLASAALAFYLEERQVNPKIQTYVDAFYYISTCASVGYADIFAVTQKGRAIASLVMIVGPSLTSHLLERPQIK